MKVDNVPSAPVKTQDNILNKSVAQAAQEPIISAKPAGDAFKVELSAKAEQLNRPQSPDEISSERVAAIRDQLAAGTYNISGKDVANKILGVLKG